MFSMSTTVFNFIALTWILASSNSALEELVCFQLPVTVENGASLYQLYQTPNAMTVTLRCPKSQYVRLRNNVTYMLPESNDIVQSGSYYCRDLTADCTIQKPCTCCSRKQYTDDHFCNKTLTFTTLQLARCNHTNDKNSTCEFQVDKIEINDGCPDYDCREDNIKPYSWCYARWVAIHYDCVFYNPGDKCSPNPCGDHGTCKTTRDNYACECDMAYTGQHCEHIGCTADTCSNRGSCEQDDNLDFNCECYKDYSGRHCETFKYACGDTHCENGGSCVEYKCVCTDGFTGQYCETSNTLHETPPAIGECVSNPCQNNGVCEQHSDRYVCLCQAGYNGTLCEVEIPGSMGQVTKSQVLVYIGIGIGVVLVLIVIIIIIAVICRKRSKRDKATPEVVYRNEEDEASTPMIMANGHDEYEDVTGHPLKEREVADALNANNTLNQPQHSNEAEYSVVDKKQKVKNRNQEKPEADTSVNPQAEYATVDMNKKKKNRGKNPGKPAVDDQNQNNVYINVEHNTDVNSNTNTDMTENTYYESADISNPNKNNKIGQVTSAQPVSDEMVENTYYESAALVKNKI